jgi:hypothetical protein
MPGKQRRGKERCWSLELSGNHTTQTGNAPAPLQRRECLLYASASYETGELCVRFSAIQSGSMVSNSCAEGQHTGCDET